MNNFMNEAKIESTKSTDLKRSIGVVITKNGKIIGRGSNQATIKWKWLIKLHTKFCFRKFLGIKKHNFYWLCPGCALPHNHSEIRALNSIKEKIEGELELYMFGHIKCCENCSKELTKNNIIKRNFQLK